MGEDSASCVMITGIWDLIFCFFHRVLVRTATYHHPHDKLKAQSPDPIQAHISFKSPHPIIRNLLPHNSVFLFVRTHSIRRLHSRFLPSQ